MDVGPPSRFGIRDLRVKPTGSTRGLSTRSSSGRSAGSRAADRRSRPPTSRCGPRGPGSPTAAPTGDIDLKFNYRVDYVLVVDYPVEEALGSAGTRSSSRARSRRAFIGERRRRRRQRHGRLLLQDPVAARRAGRCRAPLGALEPGHQGRRPAGRLRDPQPRRFGPCGGTCFVVELNLTAEKKRSSGKSLFKQICEPEGLADLVVDAPSRSFQLRNIKVKPRCKGVVGWAINFVAPFVTKTTRT